ncbi:heme-binding protein, partial [Gordonia paraffinivorans]|uniref:heme-binding protein n=1 Tax=Gordonia paraffinivorans TaxID=175628 RepID=UPI001447A815
LETAKKAAKEAASFSARKGWKVTIAIVNAEGRLVYLERGDGSYVGSIDAAI